MSRVKQKRTHYTAEFKRQAVERMKVADNIVRLARELGVDRMLLYQWEAAAEGRGRKSKSKRERQTPTEGESQSEQELREEVVWLREALTRKMRETDFFKGALQKVEERRRSSDGNGGTASTTRSGK